MKNQTTTSAASGKDYYTQHYLPGVNRIGVFTNLLGVILSFAPAFVLAVVYNILPPAGALFTAFISIASAVGILWFVEPISYFPVIGIAGTYMAFLSGNISNMRVPCSTVAQGSANVTPGTPEGSVVSALGMAVSVIINIVVLALGVLLGSSVLAQLPPVVMETLNYLLPALFGALLAQFGYRNRTLAPVMLVFALVISFLISKGVFSWLPGASNYLGILSCVFVSILLAKRAYSKQKGDAKK